MRRTVVLFFYLLFFVNFAYADHGKQEVILDANQIKIQVRGVVCSFCAFGAQKNLAKLDFLNPLELNKGVLVDVENQQITLALNDDGHIDLKQVYESIIKGGYEPEVIYMRVKGNIQEAGNHQNLIRDEASNLLFDPQAESLPQSGSIELDLHFDAHLIPSLKPDQPVKATLDKIIK